MDVRLIREVSFKIESQTAPGASGVPVIVRAEIDAAALRASGVDPKTVKLRATLFRFAAGAVTTQIGTPIDLAMPDSDLSGTTWFGALDPGAHGIATNSQAGLGIRVALSNDLNHATTGARVVSASTIDPKWAEGTITRGGT